MSAPQVPPSGVWAPAITFFNHEDDTLDLKAQKQYDAHPSKSGLVGLVILGTNAEAFLLTREERSQLISTAREAVGPTYPIMAGCAAHSGANYVLVLPPAYFGKATTPAVIEKFYSDISAKSILPIVIYNFPAVCNGVDLDSEFITKMAKQHSKIVGVKLTCASVGKITRLSASLPASEFAIFGGQSDFLIGGLSVGSAGCIAAFANVFPKALSRIYKLYKEGNFEEALKLHRIAALAESPCKAGIANTKYAAAINSAKAAGIEGAEEKLKPRTPYLPASEEAKSQIKSVMAELSGIEASL
ncbi:probable Putative 4-hydroxy-2-oxoglutarate aldolase, mitochondrial [Rhynchosporium secalis]|uniref:Probable Putative 4-hydroxy-2-oxoglutarate aldolase, mitochondrial n=1 Tax=Rhynchosporium secalis TaxID=38038 RepID=A0A1E1MBQ8_RHYSE|nr:probable Putative 4-hydroxy-2-oxoglutarate aldolase, mitochondrial [Rhynchosporium secalis]